MISYLLQAAAIIAAGWLFYTLLLRRETFFSVNRSFFLVLIIIAFIAPRFVVPRNFSLRVYFETETRLPPPLVNDHAAVTGAGHAGQAINQPVADTVAITHTTDPVFWIILIYWTGVAVLGLNFLLQLIYILYKRWKLPAIHDGTVTILEEKENQSPGSFWNYIFINPEKYEWTTYEQILAHEKVHVQKKHSVDLIMAELLVVFQWFNPFAWLMRKSIEANLEFQADHTLLDRDKVDLTGYQLSLIQVAAPNQLLNIQSAYNQSLLQQRVRMMTRKRSNLHKSWKYLAAVPVLLLIVALVNKPAVPAEESLSFSKNTTLPPSQPGDSSNTNRAVYTSTSTIKKTAEKKITQKPGSTLTTALTTRTTPAEIIPAVPERLNMSSNTIAPATLKVTDNLSVKTADPNLNNRGKGIYTAYSIAEIEKLKNAGVTTAVLTGYDNIGWADVSADDLITLYKGGVSAAIIQSYLGIGLTNLDAKTLLKLHRLPFPASRIQSYYSVGLTNVSLDSLYYLDHNDVSASSIQGFRQIGFTEVSCAKFVLLKRKKVTPSFINSFMQLGFKDITLDQSIELVERKIRANYLQQLMLNGLSIPSIGYYLKELKK